MCKEGVQSDQTGLNSGGYMHNYAKLVVNLKDTYIYERIGF